MSHNNSNKTKDKLFSLSKKIIKKHCFPGVKLQFMNFELYIYSKEQFYSMTVNFINKKTRQLLFCNLTFDKTLIDSKDKLDDNWFEPQITKKYTYMYIYCKYKNLGKQVIDSI